MILLLVLTLGILACVGVVMGIWGIGVTIVQLFRTPWTLQKGVRTGFWLMIWSYGIVSILIHRLTQ